MKNNLESCVKLENSPLNRWKYFLMTVPKGTADNFVRHWIQSGMTNESNNVRNVVDFYRAFDYGRNVHKGYGRIPMEFRPESPIYDLVRN